MGAAYRVHCHCGYKQDNLVDGFYMKTFNIRDKNNDISRGRLTRLARAGDYGKVWQTLTTHERKLYVYAGDAIYQCRNCKCIESLICLDLYNDEVSKTDPVYFYDNKCPRCNDVMKHIIIKESQDNSVICPKCGKRTSLEFYMDID